MKVINLSKRELIFDKVNICLGNFDSLHIGHTYLINLSSQTKEKNGVILLNGHIGKYLSYKKTMLIDINDKINILKNMGVDYVFLIDLKLEFLSLNPEEFISQYLRLININKIYVGKDYAFGKDRIGNVETLKKFYDVEVVDFINNERGVKISSSDIKKSIENANFNYAKKLLNRNYLIKGKVVEGFGYGSKHNLPTANIDLLDNYVLPKNGVYLTKIFFDNQSYYAMTNIGVHPTVNELNTPTIESFILNFDGNIYKKNVCLEFIEFIRDEKKFSSFDELLKQIENDIKYAKKFMIKLKNNCC